MSASYLNIDINGKLTTQRYDKRDDFCFSNLNFPNLCSNSPSSPAYEKERALSSIKMASGVALFLGIGSVTVGILSLAYLGGAGFPVVMSTGIWFGIIALTFGLVGIFAAISSDETTQKKLLNGHYITSIIIMSMAYAWAAAIQVVVACGRGEEKCGDNADIQTALHGVLIGIIVVVYMTGIYSMSHHSRNRKVLHPEWNHRRGCCWFNKVNDDSQF